MSKESSEKNEPIGIPPLKSDIRDVGKSQVDFVRERAKELLPMLCEQYAVLHEHPELGGEEFRTAEQIKKFLEAEGIEIVGEKIGSIKGSKGTGIVARIKGKEGGPTIALRADMDALPLQENKDHNHCSQEGNKMHACGHDAHMTGLIGGAKILSELAKKGQLEGNVVLLFQPSEEKAHQKESGAVQMIRFLEKNGLRKDIDAFFGIHVWAEEERGYVSMTEGPMCYSSGEVDIILTDTGGHVKNAYEQANLNRISSEITVRLSDLFQPLAEKKEALIASVGTKFVGEGYNVLRTQAESTWVVRIASPEYRTISKDIRAQIEKVVNEVVEKYDSKKTVTAKMKPRHGYRPIIHRSPDLVGIAGQSAQDAIPNFRRANDQIPGGEDFSFYLENLRGKEIPGVFAMVGSANEAKGIQKGPHHSPNFRIDEEVLAELAGLHANFTLNAIKYFKDKKKIVDDKNK